MSETKFPLGQIVATLDALSEIERLTDNNSQTMTQLLSRHASGDWGDVDPQDAKANNRALVEGTRLFSAYMIKGVRFWIITEADRPSTCVLLPEEY